PPRKHINKVFVGQRVGCLKVLESRNLHTAHVNTYKNPVGEAFRFEKSLRHKCIKRTLLDSPSNLESNDITLVGIKRKVHLHRTRGGLDFKVVLKFEDNTHSLQIYQIVYYLPVSDRLAIRRVPRVTPPHVCCQG